MVMSKTTIRKAVVGDYSSCLPLLTSLYHGDIGQDFRKAFESYVAGKSSVVLLAHSRGEIVGILIGSYQMDIDWEGKTARIDAIVVNEKKRRKGIGEKLAQSFVTLARRQRCKAVKSRVNMKNQVAQRFHESLGFARANTYEYTLDFSSQR
jgi:ribosomal protein S18 acetylase RimI-like enzyme